MQPNNQSQSEKRKRRSDTIMVLLTTLAILIILYELPKILFEPSEATDVVANESLNSHKKIVTIPRKAIPKDTNSNAPQ